MPRYHIDWNDGKVSRCSRSNCWYDFHSESEVECARQYETFAAEFGYESVPAKWTKSRRPRGTPKTATDSGTIATHSGA